MAEKDAVEPRRQYWTKMGVDRRRAHLISSDCDESWVLSLSNEQLVNEILLLDGEVAKVKAPSLDNDTAKLLAFFQQQAREDRERAQAREERAEKQAREDREALLERQRQLDQQAEQRFAELLARTTQAARRSSGGSESGRVFDDEHPADTDGLPATDSRAYRRYLEKFKRAIVPWPDTVDLPLYFSSIDRFFEEESIPAELQIALVKANMPKDVCKLLLTLDHDAVSSWTNLKEALFEYYALNANRFRDLYWSCAKRENENYSQFCLRVSTLLDHYITARGVESFDALKSLYLSDKIKFELEKRMLSEVNKAELAGFFSAKDLASFLDQTAQLWRDSSSAALYGPSNGVPMTKASEQKHGGSNSGSKNKTVVCWSCGGNHYSNNPKCPNFNEPATANAVSANVSGKQDSSLTDFRAKRLERFERKEQASINGATGSQRFGNKDANGGKFPPCPPRVD